MGLKNHEILEIMFVTVLFSGFWICVFIMFSISPEQTTKEEMTEHYMKSSVIDSGKSTESEPIPVLNVSATTEIVLNTDYDGERDSSMEQIFYSMIAGDYVINENVEYNFGKDGIFSGFFDDANMSVKGYSYEIFVVNENAVVNIYNHEKTVMVSYELILSGKAALALYYPAADLKIELK
jgi:hypothetical protein